ncbi:Uncharacterized protein TCM_001777 [Theobroma cacao]|uniref:Uncharacterized protein n=1 Tax=Theobroma cacao TaxID=3641 RepID=A0A061DJW0_THECC|nr:Uncharacterized protein TCM_001777 [Theobroma cacao]
MFTLEMPSHTMLYQKISQERTPIIALRIHMFLLQRSESKKIKFASTGCQATVPEAINADICIHGIVGMDSRCWQSWRATRRLFVECPSSRV